MYTGISSARQLGTLRRCYKKPISGLIPFHCWECDRCTLSRDALVSFVILFSNYLIMYIFTYCSSKDLTQSCSPTELQSKPLFKFLGRVSQSCPGWPHTCHPASASQVARIIGMHNCTQLSLQISKNNYN